MLLLSDVKLCDWLMSGDRGVDIVKGGGGEASAGLCCIKKYDNTFSAACCWRVYQRGGISRAVMYTKWRGGGS